MKWEGGGAEKRLLFSSSFTPLHTIYSGVKKEERLKQKKELQPAKKRQKASSLWKTEVGRRGGGI